MNETSLQFALPRAVAAIIDVERIPKLARESGIRDSRFQCHPVGHAVHITCSRELAVTFLENLRLRIRTSLVPSNHLAEYKDAVDRIGQALGLAPGHRGDD